LGWWGFTSDAGARINQRGGPRAGGGWGGTSLLSIWTTEYGNKGQRLLDEREANPPAARLFSERIVNMGGRSKERSAIH